jgi:hypothetical protein
LKKKVKSNQTSTGWWDMNWHYPNPEHGQYSVIEKGYWFVIQNVLEVDTGGISVLYTHLSFL